MHSLFPPQIEIGSRDFLVRSIASHEQTRVCVYIYININLYIIHSLFPPLQIEMRSHDYLVRSIASHEQTRVCVCVCVYKSKYV